MGLAHSPGLVTNGLVFAYDAGNAQKSWKGEPTTNLANTTGGATDWTNNDLGAAVITRTTLVDGNRYELTSTTGGGGRMSFQVSKLTNNETYNLSLKYRITSSSDASPSFTLTDWCDTSITKTTTAYDSYTYETAYGVRATYDSTYRFMDYSISDNTTVEIWDVQLEERAYATPYTATSRSNTEAIADLTGKNTITASAVTYASDGTFDFSTALDNLSLPNDIGYTTDVSAFAWFKSLGTPVGGYHIICGGQELEISVPTAGALRTGVLTTSRYVSNHGSGLMDGNWHYIGLTFSGTTKTSYIDGANEGTSVTAGALTSSFANRKIGKFGSNNTYGTPTEIPVYQVYNRALSDDEVYRNFNALRGRFGV